MWNPFKKNNSGNDDKQKMGLSAGKVGMLQSLAMKKMQNMSPQERQKLTQDMLKPENKGKLLQAMEMMKKTGMVSAEQLEEARKKLGL